MEGNSDTDYEDSLEMMKTLWKTSVLTIVNSWARFDNVLFREITEFSADCQSYYQYPGLRITCPQIGFQIVTLLHPVTANFLTNRAFICKHLAAEIQPSSVLEKHDIRTKMAVILSSDYF